MRSYITTPTAWEWALSSLPPPVARQLHRVFSGRALAAPNFSKSATAPWTPSRQPFQLRQLISLPNVLILVWLYVLWWGEHLVFRSSVTACDWDTWARWPPGATPHHLIFVADPQLIDPHTYPDRPWPLSSATIALADNYLRKSYIQLQQQLRPDTVIFLGDLFDGGREWTPDFASREDPAWAQGRRPAKETAFVNAWRGYGQRFWLQEYMRFVELFLGHWCDGGAEGRPWQRGRRVISSLPGNHDLGFAEQISLPVRDRFNAFFGDGNRVDVVGNHTFVSVDTVSMSAQDFDHTAEMQQIYGPVEEFLDGVRSSKRRALARELQFQRGEVEGLRQRHIIEDLASASFADLPSLDAGDGSPELPTILLTHVPLYRDPGTPCGPQREHWPPTPPPPGQHTPVIPDDRNAISVSKGYQYQNVLSESDSVELVEKIGNVRYAFSGDDHDYCDIVHTPRKNSLREITVKSMSFAMGVRRPGFLMLSLWNPIDASGQSLGTHGSGHGGASANAAPTLETHLCLLPDQLGIFIRYGMVLGISLAAIVARAIMMPILKLTPNFPAAGSAEEPVLPVTEKGLSNGVYQRDHMSTSSTSSTASLGGANLAARPAASRGSRNSSPDLPSGNHVYPSSQAPPTPARASLAYGHEAVRRSTYVYVVTREILGSVRTVGLVAVGWFVLLLLFA